MQEGIQRPSPMIDTQKLRASIEKTDTDLVDWLQENLVRIQLMPQKVNGRSTYGLWNYGQLIHQGLTLRDLYQAAYVSGEA